MREFVLALELAYSEGQGGFNMKECQEYVGVSAFRARKILSELIEMGWIRRSANRFYIRSVGTAVYDVMAQGQRAMFDKEQYIDSRKQKV